MEKRGISLPILSEGRDPHLTRHSPLLMTLLAVTTMSCLGVWEFLGQPPSMPVVPGRETKLRPEPARVSLPSASAGRNGPQAPSPKAAAPRAPSRAVTAATQAARQRYLENVYLLGKLIHGEARGEPYIGQVAVGAVVMNRVKSPLFPKTIAGVIFEPGAFDAVIDGQIHLPPDEEAIRAAKAAIAGWDPTGGAIYYYNPVKTTSYWIWSRPVVVVIGRHSFAL